MVSTTSVQNTERSNEGIDSTVMRFGRGASGRVRELSIFKNNFILFYKILMVGFEYFTDMDKDQREE